MISLDSITTNKKALFLAYDQGLEHGPSDFNDDNVDPNYILSIGMEGDFNGVILQKGIAEKYYDSSLKNKIPLIVKLNGKTNLEEGRDPYAPQLCTVEEAVVLGAVAVGYTVYVGSEFEDKMFSEFAQIEREAHEKGMPVIGWMYPRGRGTKGKSDEELTAYAARIGLELGADIVKIKYPGTKEALEKAVKAAGETKVVVSGGVKDNEHEFLHVVQTVMEAGAIGMAVGRNIWQHKDPLGITEKVKQLVMS